ncbi:hypothetical protein QFZ96_000781 [Paraburkholderia youngii]
MQIIFNKGAVMVLPPGINKGSGLKAALRKLSLASINVVGVGDAENDHALLNACGCSVAVANAVPMLKAAADWVTDSPRGAYPDRNVAISLLGLPLDDRPDFLSFVIPKLIDLRVRTGRPHWLVIDEAHHMMPSENEPMAKSLPADFDRVAFITVHPDHMAKSALIGAAWLVALGIAVGDTVAKFAAATGLAAPESLPAALDAGCALVWPIGEGQQPAEVHVIPPSEEHRRHVRKYATGTLGEDTSFYFRGPDGALNLRAQNLEMFCQIGEGVDDETSRHHARTRDYSRWLRDCIKDPELADEIAGIENAAEVDIQESRRKIRAAIERRYTKAG